MTDAVQSFLSAFENGEYPPELLARYEALECLGCNETGETLYLRDKQGSGYAVAKCYREGAVYSREDEGEILERLDHPGLPRFLGRYENGAMRCIVREYAQGVPLSELPAPLSAKETLDVTVQLCDLLTYLHSRTPPVIHRDIKPQNLVLGPDGRVMLIDFGISRSYDETAEADTVCLGTRAFSPPEQYGFAQTDPRADIYATGVLLRWLLTGRTDPASGLIDNRRLERIAAKCTAFAPRSRYQNAKKLKAALLWAGERGRRQRGGAMVAAALVLACCCGFWLGRVTLPPADPPAQSALTAVELSPSGFAEPLIEQAARLALGVKDDRVLTKEQLSGARTLYIVFDTAFATEQEYIDNIEAIYQEQGTPPRGTITSLDDLKLMPNLERVRIVGEHINDISGLASCPQIVDLEIKHNDITDLSPLKGLDKLENLIMMENPITDISPLYGKESLRQFELKNGPSWDKAQVAYLTDELDMLDVKGAGPYLDGKTIRELCLQQSDFSSMEDLAKVKGMRCLRANETRLSDLSGIEVHTELQQLDLSHTAVTDLTPLLELPNLYELTLDEIQKPYAEVLDGKPGLTIRYVS